jgi:phage/plasmid-associated DNA primase
MRAVFPAFALIPGRTEKGKSSGRWTPEARAVAYLDECEPAISGQKGHDKAFKAACKVGPGFDLPPDIAYRLLWEHYNPRCEPPWSEKELRHKVDDAYKKEQRRGWLLNAERTPRAGKAEPSSNGTDSEQTINFEPYKFTDMGNAERLVHRHGDDIRYVPAWKKWLWWSGPRWEIDRPSTVVRLAKRTVRFIYVEAACNPDVETRIKTAAWATTSENSARLEAMVKLAASEEKIEVLPQQLDRDPWLLNCPNGTLDLRTGELREHRREDYILVKRHEGHPTELADLFGKRIVVAIETGEGVRINEVLIKELTGSDKIRARHMREDFWEFDPTHKVLLCTNHKPVIRGTDHAIWRRIHLIPFEVRIQGELRDKTVPARLVAEYPGILAWCVQGCLDWQRVGGLEPPDEVQEATLKYRQDEDVLARFFAENCKIIPGEDVVRVKSSALYTAYREWADRSGETPVSQRRFGESMTERGFKRLTNNGIWYLGIGLNPS